MVLPSLFAMSIVHKLSGLQVKTPGQCTKEIYHYMKLGRSRRTITADRIVWIRSRVGGRVL